MKPDPSPETRVPSPEAVRAQLARLLASDVFSRTPVLRRLLEFLVLRTVEGRGEELKEYTVGLEVFGRGSDFDPNVDTIVRAHARRLRARLAEYYCGSGGEDTVLIDIPKGTYAATLELVPPRSSREQLPAPPAPTSTHTWARPLPRGPLIGRDPELAALTRLLVEQAARMITLVGPGGSGKTSLAIGAVRDVEAAFEGRVFYIALGAIADADAAGREIAYRLGLRHVGRQPLAAALYEHVRTSIRRRSLLVVDNFEQLLPAACLLAGMLDACEHLTILATSRTVLRLSRETVFAVPPLPVPGVHDRVTPADLAMNPAVALFVQRARAIDPAFALTEANAQAVGEICRRLDGLPLAIELAAARVRVLTPAQIRDRLSSPFDLLTGGPSDAPPRQQTLRGTLEWSHALLTGAERTLFRRLSAFSGGWTLEAAEAVGNTARDLGIDVLDGLSSLLDKNLIHAVGGAEVGRRFAMLETVREFARERLEASGELDQVLKAHAAYCVVLAEDGMRARTPEEFAAWLAACEVERENCRAALTWLIETRNAAWATRLSVALYRYWEHRGHLAEGRVMFEAVIALQGSEASTMRARALGYAAALASHQGDHDIARGRHVEALEMCRHLGDAKGAIAQLNALAGCERFRGNDAAALDWAAQTLSACRELGEPAAVAAALSNLGITLAVVERYADARSRLQEAVALFASIGHPAGMAWCRSYLGDVARAEGVAAEAGMHYEAAEAMFRASSDAWGLARAACDRGQLACDEGHYSTARELLEEAVQAFERLGHRRGTASAVDGLARLALAEGDAVRALTLAGAAAALRRSAGAVPRSEQDRKVERTLDLASVGCSPERARQLWTAGAAMLPDGAIALALTR